MTTRRTAEALLFETPEKGCADWHNLIKTESLGVKGTQPITTETLLPIGSKVMATETLAAIGPRVTRRRVNPIYCRSCAGWVEVLLQTVRLRCVACEAEMRP